MGHQLYRGGDGTGQLPLRDVGKGGVGGAPTLRVLEINEEQPSDSSTDVLGFLFIKNLTLLPELGKLKLHICF
jgi:hypothetical protein